MTRTAFTAISLTFLMALLVLTAAIVFLWQGRQTLRADLRAQSTAQAALESELVSLETKLGAESAALVASQADLATRSAEFARSEQETVALQQQVATLEATILQAEVLTGTVQVNPTPDAGTPPQVEIAAPNAGETVIAGNPVEIIVFVGHTAGVEVVNLAVDGVNIDTYRANGLPFFPIEKSYTFQSAGPSVISAVATSTLGIVGPAELVTVTVVAPTPVTSTSSLAPFETGWTDMLAASQVRAPRLIVSFPPQIDLRRPNSS